MLRILDIHKQYVTGTLVQTALDGVSLTLRDNEFVAILGPSGSGKTTLLNVIGGLDRYDSGDLIINNISTKKYSDRDWDSYRNHTVGFVFQSYNLIPHQSVLSNVELALTISGISRSERRRRAAKALADVGLGDQLHKRPNQMSGGQMQRVAIARALVNNPDILLADEPTGALDSETSVQVMDLLKEVSKDRLVVMVTHNPELAEEYANRIVRVRDGKIIDDSNPYDAADTDAVALKHKNMGRASMSFFTALSLSFNNLRTKKGRTILTAFAGSIGIIGIALILSLSTGFQRYIDQIQEDTLSNYPLSIQSETADMMSMMSAFGNVMSAGKDAPEKTVVEQQVLTQMFAQVGTNDLESFKSYFEEHKESVDPYINGIKYYYGIKPRIYLADTSDGAVQVNPGVLFGQMMGMSPMAAYMDSDIFYELIDNTEMLNSQYEVLTGRWPETKEELVIVLSSPSQITDYMAYTLGLKDTKILEDFMRQMSEGKDVVFEEALEQWTYDDLMALEFQLVPASGLYRHNSEYNVWEDMSEDRSYMKNLIESGISLGVVGVVAPKADVSTTLLSPGVAYTNSLTNHVIEQATESEIVAKQLSNPQINVFTGKPFGEKDENSLKFEDMISVDGEKIASAFDVNIDTSSIMTIVKNYIKNAYGSIDVDTAPAREDFLKTFSALAYEMLNGFVAEHADESGNAELRIADVSVVVDSYLSLPSSQSILTSLENKYQLPSGTMEHTYQPLLMAMLTGFVATESVPPELPDLPDIPDDPVLPTEPDVPGDAPEQEDSEITTPEALDTGADEEAVPDHSLTEEKLLNSGNVLLNEYQTTLLTESEDDDSGNVTVPDEEISDTVETIYAVISADDVDGIVSNFMSIQALNQAADVVSAAMMGSTVRDILLGKLEGLLPTIMSYVGSGFSVDEQVLASAFQFNMNEEDLLRLMTAMSGGQKDESYDSNLRKLGYARFEKPTAISIYFTDFEGKGEFLAFLDDYNEKMEAAGKEDCVISYTDVTSIMMSSVRTIIDSVSYVLIAFVGVALVVSSIMIGIITYISVMERTKEIGVLRAIGASKNNISQVFNAETFIIGLCSGLIGVGCTLLLNIPINYIIHDLTDNTAINAQLPIEGAVILIVLSMILTLIGGLIPSRHAAKKDPVIALRSE